jgi:hypothetical protein
MRHPIPPRIFIPTNTNEIGRRTEGYLGVVHLKGLNTIRHLLWNSLFRGIRIIDWYLLFEIYFSQNKGKIDLSGTCFYDVLRRCSVTYKGTEHYFVHSKPIFRELQSYVPNENCIFQGKNLLDLYLLKLEIPQKGMPLDSIVSYRKYTSEFPVPPPKSYIGVGYKDKGSMGPEVHIAPEGSKDSETFLSFDFENFSKLLCLILESFHN